VRRIACVHDVGRGKHRRADGHRAVSSTSADLTPGILIGISGPSIPMRTFPLSAMKSEPSKGST
jgi:hypothetical protein